MHDYTLPLVLATVRVDVYWMCGGVMVGGDEILLGWLSVGHVRYTLKRGQASC